MLSRRLNAALELLFSVGSFLLAFFLSLTATYLILSYTDGFTKNVFAQGVGNCFVSPAADGKDEAGPPFGDDFEPDIPDNFIIYSVFIKSGDTCFGPYTVDGTYEEDVNSEDACYSVTGIGTSNLTATRDGEGEGLVCQEISHIEVLWETEGSPTSTPSPTPTEIPQSVTPTLTLTPTPIPSITPTDIVSPTPTDSITPTLSPTPTIEVTVAVTATSTPTPTTTPTGQVAGTSTTSENDPEDPDTPEGQVLGASTLAGTGSLENFLIVTGVILFIISLYGDTKKSTKKPYHFSKVETKEGITLFIPVPRLQK